VYSQHRPNWPNQTAPSTPYVPIRSDRIPPDTGPLYNPHPLARVSAHQSHRHTTGSTRLLYPHAAALELLLVVSLVLITNIDTNLVRAAVPEHAVNGTAWGPQARHLMSPLCHGSPIAIVPLPIVGRPATAMKSSHAIKEQPCRPALPRRRHSGDLPPPQRSGLRQRL
jgi:hypothetical protein